MLLDHVYRPPGSETILNQLNLSMLLILLLELEHVYRPPDNFKTLTKPQPTSCLSDPLGSPLPDTALQVDIATGYHHNHGPTFSQHSTMHHT